MKTTIRFSATVALWLLAAQASGQTAAPAGSAAAAITASPSSMSPAEGAPLARGGHAHLKAGAALRARSQPDEDPDDKVGADSLLTLKVVLKKDTGAWWYVTSPEGSGWVLDADLVPASE